MIVARQQKARIEHKVDGTTFYLRRLRKREVASIADMIPADGNPPMAMVCDVLEKALEGWSDAKDAEGNEVVFPGSQPALELLPWKTMRALRST